MTRRKCNGGELFRCVWRINNPMVFRETLPEGCPPETAEEISQARVVFRLTRANPPTANDFRSQRSEKPNNKFSGITECQARGLSVFTDFDRATQALRLRNMRGRLICQVQLTDGTGFIMDTGRRGHCTWWPLADFDILANCSVIDP